MPILVQRDIEYGDLVAACCIDALQELDISFDSGDECRASRVDQSKLLQCAQAVGVAVECVEESHGVVPASEVFFSGRWKLIIMS